MDETRLHHPRGGENACNQGCGIWRDYRGCPARLVSFVLSSIVCNDSGKGSPLGGERGAVVCMHLLMQSPMIITISPPSQLQGLPTTWGFVWGCRISPLIQCGLASIHSSLSLPRPEIPVQHADLPSVFGCLGKGDEKKERRGACTLDICQTWHSMIFGQDLLLPSFSSKLPIFLFAFVLTEFCRRCLDPCTLSVSQPALGTSRGPVGALSMF